MPSLTATSVTASVELTSPGTITRSGRSCSMHRLDALHHARGLDRVAARAHAEHVVGRRHPELLQEDLGHHPVVVLAGVDQDVARVRQPPAQRGDDRRHLDEVGPRPHRVEDPHSARHRNGRRSNVRMTARDSGFNGDSAPPSATELPMPTFCRHNRLIQNCPICTREQAVEMRPIVTSSAPRTGQPRPSTPRAARAGSAAPARATGGGRMTVRRVARGADDGYHNSLVIGLKSSTDAGRLADEVALAEHRLRVLEHDPPGLYREVADAAGDVEERSWLAFLIAYLSPLEEHDPFAEIARVRTSWASGMAPDLEAVRTGSRTAHDPARGARTLDAYRTWAARAGSQATAFTGDAGWTSERRFARAFERLSLPGLHRNARFDLLVTMGRLGVYDIQAGSLALGGENDVTVGAKRALGIGDPLLLERRASDLAGACGVPLEALDLGLHNWQRAERATLGLGPDAEPEPEILAAVQAALGL